MIFISTCRNTKDAIKLRALSAIPTSVGFVVNNLNMGIRTSTSMIPAQNVTIIFSKIWILRSEGMNGSWWTTLTHPMTTWMIC